MSVVPVTKDQIFNSYTVSALPIAILPDELLNYLRKCMTALEIYKLGRASKHAAKVMDRVVRKYEPIELKKFIKELTQELSPSKNAYQIEKLNSIGVRIDVNSFPYILKFVQRDKYLCFIKDQIIDELETLEAVSIQNLSQITAPRDFGNFFGVTEICRRIALSYPNEWVRGGALRVYSKTLTETGACGRAIKVVNTISDRTNRETAFQEIFHNLLKEGTQEGKIIEAIDAAKGAITDETQNWSVLYVLYQALACAGRYEQALEVAEAIPDQVGRESAIHNINNSSITNFW